MADAGEPDGAAEVMVTVILPACFGELAETAPEEMSEEASMAQAAAAAKMVLRRCIFICLAG
jgi:hypothetical protein